MNKNRNISFNEEAYRIIEKYATENNCSFNRALNDLIIHTQGNPEYKELIRLYTQIKDNMVKLYNIVKK